jgi:hypothetical protein
MYTALSCIGGSHSGRYEECALVGCSVMHILESPTFRSNMSLRSSKSESKPSNKLEEADGRLIQHAAAVADVLVGLGRPHTNCVKTNIKTWDKRNKSWRQHHDLDRCTAVFIISFVSTVLLSLRHVADIVSWLLHVLTHAGVRPINSSTPKIEVIYSSETSRCLRSI